MVEISIITSLYRCEQYIQRYFNAVEKISNLAECEFIFIHNDPTPEEESALKKCLGSCKLISYQYISVPRESLYASWNRAINLSKGRYLAIWNVDDVRYPKSLQVQKDMLLSTDDIGLVYGDRQWITSLESESIKTYRARDVYKKIVPDFQDGAFIMWKKSVHDRVGFFDEQFLISGDRDFWFRVSCFYKIKKVQYIMGVFLYGENSLSNNLPQRYVENAIITFRYGIVTPQTLLKLISCKRIISGNNHNRVNSILCNQVYIKLDIKEYWRVNRFLLSMGTSMFLIIRSFVYKLYKKMTLT
jgi:hypothetical protein